jgi:TolA-binding protein
VIPPRALALVLLLASACVSVHRPAWTRPTAARQWPSTLTLARSQATAGDFSLADSTLSTFATRYPNAPEAAETQYWRALFRLDPQNARSSAAGAIAALDTYLADTTHRKHIEEAVTLRRVAVHLDAISKLVGAAQAQAKDANAAANAAGARVETRGGEVVSAESEIKRLKDELAKANAELERIRKRLAPPPKP